MGAPGVRSHTHERRTGCYMFRCRSSRFPHTKLRSKAAQCLASLAMFGPVATFGTFRIPCAEQLFPFSLCDVYNAVKKCIIATMDLNEINERMDKASARRKSFDTNRSLCAVVAVFIGYSFYNGIKEGAELWFYIVMPLLIAVAIFLVVFDTKRINQAKAELEELRRKKEALEPKIEEDDDDSSDDDDDSEVASESDAAGSDEKSGENE